MLKKLGFELVRFKTGTPPRIHRIRSILVKRKFNQEMSNRSFFPMKQEEPIPEQMPCWLTYTRPENS